jgi:uncharacterized protein (DUF983 family)
MANDVIPVFLVRLCPHCGSGDVQWCQISVRPYCADCGLWGAVNFGTADDAVRAWNDQLIRAGVIEYL